jgi:hypothetical protein
MSDRQIEKLMGILSFVMLGLFILGIYHCVGRMQQERDEAKKADISTFDSLIGVRDHEAIKIFGESTSTASGPDYFLSFEKPCRCRKTAQLSTSSIILWSYYRKVTFEVHGHYIQDWRAE